MMLIRSLEEKYIVLPNNYIIYDTFMSGPYSGLYIYIYMVYYFNLCSKNVQYSLQNS